MSQSVRFWVSHFVVYLARKKPTYLLWIDFEFFEVLNKFWILSFMSYLSLGCTKSKSSRKMKKKKFAPLGFWLLTCSSLLHDRKYLSWCPLMSPALLRWCSANLLFCFFVLFSSVFGFLRYFVVSCEVLSVIGSLPVVSIRRTLGGSMPSSSPWFVHGLSSPIWILQPRRWLNHRNLGNRSLKLCRIPVRFNSINDPLRLLWVILCELESLEEYEHGIADCRFNLRGRVTLNKGDTPLPAQALKLKLSNLWPNLQSWLMIPLGKWYFELSFSSLEDLRRIWALGVVNLKLGFLCFFC